MRCADCKFFRKPSGSSEGSHGLCYYSPPMAAMHIQDPRVVGQKIQAPLAIRPCVAADDFCHAFQPDYSTGMET